MRIRDRAVLPFLLLGLATACGEVPSAPDDGPTAPGLGKAQAGARPERTGLDDRFAHIAAAAPGFAGFYLGDDGELTVRTTRPGQSAGVVGAIRSALAGWPRGAVHRSLDAGRVRFVRADYGFAELAEWHDRIFETVLTTPGFALLDIDERENRIRVGLAHASSFPRVLQALDALQVPREAVVLEVAQPDPPMQSLQGYSRPLRGGLQISSDFGTCTIGFVAAYWSAAYFWEYDRYVFTNSHCTEKLVGRDPSNPPYGQPFKSSLIGYEWFDPSPWRPSGCPSGYQCRHSDAAMIGLAEVWYVPDATYDLGGIAKTTGLGSLVIDTTTSFRIVGEGPSPVLNEPLQAVGRTSGWRSGSVTQTCITVAQAGTSIAFLCQDRFSAPISGGDSGSPVFKISSGNDVLLYGMAWGGTSTYTTFSSIGNLHMTFGGFSVY